jgi:hypothetical protein
MKKERDSGFSQQGVEVRKPMQRGSINIGLEGVLESVSEGRNQ